MWQRWLLLGLLLFLVPWVPLFTGTHSSPAPVVVAAGERYSGDLSTFDQPVIVLGEVDGDVTSWAGLITVYGIVRGDVVSYTGAIELDAGAVVEGNVLAVAGGITIANPVTLQGAVIGIEPLAGAALVTSLVNVLSGQTSGRRWLPPGSNALITWFVVLLLSIAVTLIWPRRTAGIGRALRAAPLRSALVGLLSTVLILLAMPFLLGLLTLSLVGLLLFIPLVVLLHLPYVVGFTGIARAIAATWPPAVALNPPLATVSGALIMIVPLVIISLVSPLAGMLAGYAIASWGLGAALISRGGALPIWRDAW
ncbi:MAG: bactofilin family protein [Chloroflexus sp.]|uniref:bactofilin family protein n=1 Tax=Chloroflexus sp. TaxID=1904827 RepID=UPI00404ACB95